MELSDLEKLVATVVGFAVPVLVGVMRQWWKDRADVRMERIRWAAGLAYNVTNEVAKFTETKVDDKVAYALGVFVQALGKAGIKPTDAEVAMAKLQWQAMHGAEKMALSIASPK